MTIHLHGDTVASALIVGMLAGIFVSVLRCADRLKSIEELLREREEDADND